MPILTPAALLDAIETSLFILPEIPGRLTHLTIPGLHGRVTTCAHPLANFVGAATFADAAEADAGITAIRTLAQERSLPFGWLVGPSSTPGDLRERLLAAGFVKGSEMAGMVLHDLATSIPLPSDDITVREIPPDDLPLVAPLMADAYGLPLDVSQLLADSLSAPSPHHVRSYFAYVAGEEAPIGCAFGTYLADSPIFLLGGAATLPAYRGKGAYRALVARRLADARTAGRTASVIQAVRTTSAPICARLGFEEVCNLEMYVYLPG